MKPFTFLTVPPALGSCPRPSPSPLTIPSDLQITFLKGQQIRFLLARCTKWLRFSNRDRAQEQETDSVIHSAAQTNTGHRSSQTQKTRSDLKINGEPTQTRLRHLGSGNVKPWVQAQSQKAVFTSNTVKKQQNDATKPPNLWGGSLEWMLGRTEAFLFIKSTQFNPLFLFSGL